MGDGGGGHWLVWMEWRPARWSVCLPLFIFPCTIKSRSSLLALAHPGGPGKRAGKRLWWWWWFSVQHWLVLAYLPVNKVRQKWLPCDFCKHFSYPLELLLACLELYLHRFAKCDLAVLIFTELCYFQHIILAVLTCSERCVLQNNEIAALLSSMSNKRWRGGAVGKVLDLRSIGHEFKSYSGQHCVTTLGKLFTPMPLSPSSITWYRPKGCDALWLGR